MQTIDVSQAQSVFPRLIEAVVAGDEVIITQCRTIRQTLFGKWRETKNGSGSARYRYSFFASV